MPELAGRHYMNPAYGRTIAQADGDDGDAEACAKPAAAGELKHVAVHPSAAAEDGGFSVRAHYEHPSAGHHTVESKHASAEDAAEAVKQHLRGHESRHAASSNGNDESES